MTSYPRQSHMPPPNRTSGSGGSGNQPRNQPRQHYQHQPHNNTYQQQDQYYYNQPPPPPRGFQSNYTPTSGQYYGLGGNAGSRASAAGIGYQGAVGSSFNDMGNRRSHHSNRRAANFPRASHTSFGRSGGSGLGGGVGASASAGSAGSHSSRASNQRQQRPKSPEESLDQYTFDDVTPEQVKALDIYPQVVEDLLSPGKAVCYLTQIITVAENQFKNAGSIKFETKSVKSIWVGFMTIDFPQQKTFTCKHRNKKECKNLCSLAAIYHLRSINAVDSRLKLNIDHSVTNSFIDNSRGPVPVTPLPMNIKQQMMSFISKFDEYVANLIEYQIENAKKKFDRYDIGGVEGKHAAILEGLEPDEAISVTSGSIDKSETSSLVNQPGSGSVDIFNSRPYVAPDSRKKAHAFSALKKVFSDKDSKYQTDDSFYSMIQAQERLPIRSLKDTIIKALQNHRAIVVAGDTGSGKSTQVPQFILENFLSGDSNSNSFINIAITQPRRISAISLAERVASELGEPSVGYTVGHNVRFDSRSPNRDLNIMTFFTTGMLLRKLHYNSDLKGVTHLVIDEVHERDCTTDFLLILIKRLLTRRKDLKVILMSASMDAKLFARYFDNCPVINVSGRCYPVNDHYLEDIYRQLRLPREDNIQRSPKLKLRLLVDLIIDIDETRDQGAILCFMPGWKDMKALQKELETANTRNLLVVLLVHSKLPIAEQRLIFSKVLQRERKVILATNIAETSLTINDVRYVIDTGLCNSIDYDPELNMSTFGTRWISHANAKQRSGRAGRTCPGECFKLYSREEESEFQDFPYPELLRIPLESVIMEVKCHCPDEKAVSFLSQAIQYPTISAIHNALEELLSLGVIDPKENLTVLGKRISDFSTHPRLSVSLVVAAALRCLYPVLNASAILSSTQEPFLNALTDKGKIRTTKKRLCMEAIGPGRDSINLISDHIAFGNLLAQYDNAAMSKHELEFFVQENDLNRMAMTNFQECRNLYAKMMISSRFVGPYEWYSLDSLSNRNMNELELMIASLTYAFYPKVVRVIKGLVKGGRMYPNKAAPTDTQSNNRVRFASDSIVKNVSLGKQLSLEQDDGESDDSDYISTNDMIDDKRPTFITYMNSRMDQEAGQIVVRDGSVTPALTLMLFGGRELSVFESSNRGGGAGDSGSDNTVIITLDRHNLLSFKVSKEDATAIQEWRYAWQRYLSWFIHTRNTGESVDSNDSIIAGTMNEFLELNKKLYASIK